MGFQPSGAAYCSDVKFIGAENKDPKSVKIENFAHILNCPSRATVLHHFTKFAAFVRVHRWLLSFFFNLVAYGDKQPSYMYFPSVGAFSHKFSIAPGGELLIGSEKSYGVQKWHGSPL